MDTNIHKIYGKLEMATQEVIFAKDTLQKEWDKGNIRLRKQDIERAKKYLKIIKVYATEAKSYLDKFNAIAPELQK